MFKLLFVPLLLAQLLPQTLGDGVDWIDPSYIKSYPSRKNLETAKSARGIVNRARSSAKNGPFTVTKGSNIKAPSGKEQDYLSWAPYHWPDCKWCNSRSSGGARQADYGPNDSNNDTTHSDAEPSLDDPLDDAFLPDLTQDLLQFSVETINPTETPRAVLQDASVSAQQSTQNPGTITSSTPQLSTGDLAQNLQGSHEGVEADHRATPTGGPSCSPSPTTSMAPSATWTKCAYVARDGKVNPDRNQLHGLSQLNTFAQSTIDNALAFVLENDPNAANNAASFIDAFLLHPKTGMLPSIPWGQTIRGPSQRGSYMGVLDFRVMVKVANAVQILRVMNSTAWTSDRETKMVKWARSFVSWLETDELGMRPKKSANNHSSFYYGQIAALKILLGDEAAALEAVRDYFSGPFREQIVSSGEQPFESTRTKPYHYRAFNLQAMVAVAKLGDYLGVNMWTAQTKYKSTIKTAVDYLISLDPGHEDPGDAFALVAAALAVYGDDQKSTYQRFLENGGNNEKKSSAQSKTYPYKTKTWWFYQQPDALKHSPLAMHRRDLPWDSEEEGVLYPYAAAKQEVLGGVPPFAPAFNTVSVIDDDTARARDPGPLMSHSPATAVAGEETLMTGTPATPPPSSSCVTTHPQNPDQSDECASAINDVIAGGARSDPTRTDGGAADVLPVVMHPDRPEPFASTDVVELDEGIYVYWWQIRHLYEQSSMKRSAWSRG